MEIHKDHWAVRHIKEIIIGLIISTVVSMVGTIGTLYMANRLAPFAETDRRLEQDVQALFEGDVQRRGDHDKITAVEAKIGAIEKNVNDIKSDVKDIRNYLLK